MRIPASTYRVQFGGGFGFRDAAALVPYLHRLGITDFYASPIFKARTGSTSGYDVTDPLCFHPELGSDADFEQFAAALKEHGLGLIIDIVPNHMAAHPENAWWMDVLENGSCSPHAFYFDIDWDPASHPRQDRVLLPILGLPYGAALERQELKLVLQPEGLGICYGGRKLPVDPVTYSNVIGYRLNGGLEPLQELTRFIAQIPPRTSTDPEQIAQRYRDKEALKGRLWKLYSEDGEVRKFLDENIRAFNGTSGDPRSFDLLDDLLSHQAYSLSFWRVAREKINYRRFFDISDLVAIRTEDPEVFVNTHALVLQLLAEGKATGVRLDHIDGLNDPQGYLERFREHAPDIYLVAEKILCGPESLPAEWPINGATGYEFISAVNGVLVEPDGLSRLDTVYAKFTNEETNFEEVVYRGKKAVIDQMFAGETLSLSVQLGLLADQDRHARDLSPAEIRSALIEVTACLPVYRTYTRSFEVAPRDVPFLEAALREARRRNPAGDSGIDDAVFDFLQRVLMLQFPPGMSQDSRTAVQRFVRRWQQFSGPVTAKGLEDTAMYLHNRLISMNDVGSSPQAWTREQFHHFNEVRQKSWRLSLNTTSTHDTKRSEDIRARLHVLSEETDAWAKRLKRWSNWNARCKPLVAGVPMPEANTELYIYQTLLGAWPLDPGEVEGFRKRLAEALLKSVREARRHTSWTLPNQEYEKAVTSFADAILTPFEGNRFLPDLLEFQEQIAFHGAIQSLAQVLLRLTSPGVPDTYQGTELWDFSMVDPDNRRPVDFNLRRRMLDTLDGGRGEEFLENGNWKDGGVKLRVLHQLLELRRDHRELLTDGGYIPLTATGSREDHVLAFARQAGAAWLIVVAPRFTLKLAPGRLPVGKRIWGDTEIALPENAPLHWSNLFTGGSFRIPDSRKLPLPFVLHKFPIALLTSIPQGAKNATPS